MDITVKLTTCTCTVESRRKGHRKFQVYIFIRQLDYRSYSTSLSESVTSLAHFSECDSLWRTGPFPKPHPRAPPRKAVVVGFRKRGDTRNKRSQWNHPLQPVRIICVVALTQCQLICYFLSL